MKGKIMQKKVELPIGQNNLIIETGVMAKQADGAVLVQYGGTVVLVSAVISEKPREGADFFPLFVEYQEKTYAAGRIPGGFFKREGRPSETAACSLSFGAYAKQGGFAKLVLVDVEKLMRDSNEGRDMMALNQHERDEVMKLEYEKSQEIGKLRGEIEGGMRQANFDRQALQDKHENLMRVQRDAKHELECKREDFTMSVKKREFVLRNKIVESAKEHFGKESGDEQH